ncbi:ArsR/SmtB family transcription factor [Brevibacterium yomogidense]|uniref:ArsR/SmtB family transcription factor n=1 Tax=Brevibacterium yomogidense TaxID=946573 RepID=UPI0018E01D96|nr:metalloregulator ArsR/SmtB family transcription factor [Brevibacterium yomogidense]
MSSISDQRPLYEIKANLFKGLAHPFRIRILELLAAAHDRAQVEAPAAEPGEMSVSALLRETELEASHLSQHLAVLRRHRLVGSQRRGSHVYYRLLHTRVADMLAVVRSLVLDTLAADEKLLAEAGTLPKLHTTPLAEGERS